MTVPPPARSPMRVFVLDDQDIMRHGTCAVLSQDAAMQIVGESGDLDLPGDRISELKPHVVLVGTLGDLDRAVHTVTRLRSGWPELKTLVLSPADQEDAVPRAVAVGAAGHLSRHVSGPQLARALRATAAGRTMLDPAEAVLALRRQREEPRRGDVLDQLTAQERKVLELMAQGMSNREIGEQLYVVEKTVRNHVTRILAKLGVQRRTQAALIASQLLDGETPTAR